MSYAVDDKQVRESIDSNLEVKTGSSPEKYFDGQNDEEIRNAVEVMSNHLKSSSQLIHFKNLDNIINAAIVLLSKQTGEIEAYKKNHHDLMESVRNNKKDYEEKILALEKRIVIIEESSKKGKSELEHIIDSKIAETKGALEQEVKKATNNIDEKVNQQNAIMDEYKDTMLQQRDIVQQLADKFEAVEGGYKEMGLQLNAQIDALVVDLQSSKEKRAT